MQVVIQVIDLALLADAVGGLGHQIEQRGVHLRLGGQHGEYGGNLVVLVINRGRIAGIRAKHVLIVLLPVDVDRLSGVEAGAHGIGADGLL